MMNSTTKVSQPILKEYGRNIEMLIEYLKTLTDSEKRNKLAFALVNLMKQISPTVKETNETNQKLWDDLYIMANFDLEVESPFSKPDASIINKKPSKMEYGKNKIKYKHYGKNIELLIQQAINKEDDTEKENAVIYIGKLMKSLNSTWNKEITDDNIILENIKTLSDNQLSITIEKVREGNLFEKLYKTKTRNHQDDRSKSHSNNNNRKNIHRGRRKN